MLANVLSGAVLGVDAYIITAEIDISTSSPILAIVGLPDAAVQESKERVRSAIRNSGFDFPQRRITINLAPADTKKEGPSFDLPIAVGLLLGSEQIVSKLKGETLIIGELSLDGSVRPVSGILPIALKARDSGIKNLIVPELNTTEAAIVGGINVYPVKTLEDVVQVLHRPDTRIPVTIDPVTLMPEYPPYAIDFSDVKGQENVKRGMEIAAAGGHNLLMIGPPGSGKTMLAKRLPTILPPMTVGEALETTKIYSVSGMLMQGTSLVTTRPFRSPHHTLSNAALVGGGSVPRPGEVSLSHNGVLFLDELPEFKRDGLEVLRQPLEDGIVTISRVQASFQYPARFILAAAMNPCTCGYYGDQHRKCTCNESMVRKYQQKVSGPLLDRIDLHIEVQRLAEEDLVSNPKAESSLTIRKRVQVARDIQTSRFEGRNFYCNAQMGSKEIREFCPLNTEVIKMLRAAIQQLSLSARAYDRIIKVARTIADLSGNTDIEVGNIVEAIQYRSLDRKMWA